MNAATEQTEILLLDLERRVGVLQESSEKLETQLKVMLVLESGHFPNELVARIARTLASCLRSRGDLAQAGQYAQMAANLERRHSGARLPVGGAPVGREDNIPDADSSGRREREKRAGSEQGSPGQSPLRHLSFVSRWSAWTSLNRRTALRLGR